MYIQSLKNTEMIKTKNVRLRARFKTRTNIKNLLLTKGKNDHDQVKTVSVCIYHRFRWYATLENKHPRKRFQNFRQSYVLSTDQIKIHQSQPLVWPSELLYVMLAGSDG